MEIESVSSAIGAHVRGVDLSKPLETEELEELRVAFAQYGVLFFREQTLTPESQICFAETWGRIIINRFFTPVEGFPQVAEVRKEPHQSFNVGGGWHTDHSYDVEPALGSILCAKNLPALGGDTLFAGMSAAYDALSDGLKKTLSGLNALHSSRHVFGDQADMPADIRERFGNAEKATQDTIHPVVIAHPLSGRKTLYVNPGFTRHFEGWTIAESRPLLDYLYEHASNEAFTYRFRWEPGSVVFWDNRATWHYAVNDYQGQSRLMHRITLDGEAVSA